MTRIVHFAERERQSEPCRLEKVFGHLPESLFGAARRVLEGSRQRIKPETLRTALPSILEILQTPVNYKILDAVATQQMRKLGVPAALPRLDRLLARAFSWIHGIFAIANHASIYYLHDKQLPRTFNLQSIGLLLEPGHYR